MGVRSLEDYKEHRDSYRIVTVTCNTGLFQNHLDRNPRHVVCSLCPLSVKTSSSSERRSDLPYPRNGFLNTT